MNPRIAFVGHVDHGKSTVIGRLLADAGQTREDRHERVREYCNGTGRKFEYAFLLDALEEEQSQGITIDVTEVGFSHGEQAYQFVDTPGHREFLKKLVGGASRVDAAVVVVDAVEGIQSSFYRQMHVLDLLGIQQRIVLVNKMDLVGWNENIFSQREDEILKRAGGQQHTPWIIPAAAWHGANLLERSEKMSWYDGPTLVQALALVKPGRSLEECSLRFVVQDVYSWDAKRVYVGRVESGVLRLGDRLEFFPGATTSVVTGIEVYGETRDAARAGEAVGLTLADPLFLDRGAMAYPQSAKPTTVRSALADMFWLDPTPLNVGDRLRLMVGPRRVNARVERVERAFEDEQLHMKSDAKCVKLFGRVQLRFSSDWAFDSFDSCEPMGRFVVARENESLVLGGGRFVSPCVEAPAARGHVYWMTGLSGAGKSTLARTLEKKLTEENIPCCVLDGDDLRLGLCRDLGFSLEDRRENIRRVAEVAGLMANVGLTVLVATISPAEEHRALAKAIVGADRWSEVFVECSLAACEQRDPKGLYAQARTGALANFTGVSAPYETPRNPDLKLKTEALSPELTAQQFIQWARTKGGNDEKDYRTC